jgi:hypothetical protein
MVLSLLLQFVLKLCRVKLELSYPLWINEELACEVKLSLLWFLLPFYLCFCLFWNFVFLLFVWNFFLPFLTFAFFNYFFVHALMEWCMNIFFDPCFLKLVNNFPIRQPNLLNPTNTASNPFFFVHDKHHSQYIWMPFRRKTSFKIYNTSFLEIDPTNLTRYIHFLASIFHRRK